MVRMVGRLAVVQGEQFPSDWLPRRAGLVENHFMERLVETPCS